MLLEFAEYALRGANGRVVQVIENAIGYFDDDGRLRFLTRVKDVFRVGGENVGLSADLAQPETARAWLDPPSSKK